MNDVEYILRVVLKARDDMALVLSKARTEIRAFARDANSMNTAVTNLNGAMQNFDGHLGTLTSKLQAWHDTLRNANSDGKDLAKTFNTVGKAADDSTKKIGQAAKTQKDLAAATSVLNQQRKDLARSLKAGAVDEDYAIKKFKELGTELDRLGKKFTVGTEQSKRVFKWAQASRAAADSIIADNKALTESEKARAAAIAKAMDNTKVAGVRQKDLAASVRILRQEYKELHEEEKNGIIGHGYAAKAYQELGREIDKLWKKMSLGTRESQRTFKVLDEIKAAYESAVAETKKAADTITAAQAELERKSRLHHKQLGEELLAHYNAEADAAKAHHKQLGEELLARYNDEVATAKAAHKQIGEGLLARYNAEVASAKSHHKQVGEELLAQYNAEVASAKAHHKQVGDALLARYNADVAVAKAAHKQVGEALLAQYNTEVAYEAKKKAILDRRSSQEKERIRLARESARIDSGEASPVDIKKAIADYNALGRQYQRSSFRAREFAHEVDRLSTIHKKATTDTDRHISILDKLSTQLGHSGKSAAGFDNQMRGTGILFGVAAINELISAAIALGGELVSLAGSAVMAGGALGGILAAGAAQALPVMGLLAGAASRAKSVFEAFQQSQVLDKAKFTDGQKQGQKSIDQANQLANAQDTVAAANDRLAESRDNLTNVQAEGVDQLEDLIYAEKQAALAARGAALDVKGAQEALADAISTGADQLEIDQRRQALAEAQASQGRGRTTLRRATRDRAAAGGKVENLDSVKNAAKAVDDAEKAVTKANRGLDQAVDKTDRAASTTMTAAANLDYLLSQMAPAERKLYESLKGFYDNYKRIFSGTSEKDGIYGVIITSFSRAVDKVNEIIQMPDVIKTVQDLSNEISKQLDNTFDSFTTPEGINQLQGFMENATENLGPIVEMATDLAHAFLNISETANPAFQKLLEYLGPVVDKFLSMTEDSGKMEKFFLDGEEHLESWLDLVGAIIGLFATLVGASAESGQTSIEDLTEKIKTWTDWLKDNRKDVVGFFEDARVAAYKIGGVLEHLAVTLFNTFTPDRVDDLARIFNEVLIPALEEVMDAIGKITDTIADLLKYPLFADVAKWAVAFALFGTVAGAIVGVFAKILNPIARFVGVVSKAAQGTGALSKILQGFGKITLRALPFVGWGIGIALLLKQFGLLDDAWDEIKQAAGALWGQIQPPLERFMESFSRLVDAVKEGKGAFAVIVPLVREFLEVVVELGGWLLQGIAKAVGQVIGGVIDILGGVIDIITGILTGDMGLVWEGIKDILLGIANTIIGLVQLVFFRGIGRGLSALWGALKSGLKELPGLIWGAIKVLPELFARAFKWGADRGVGIFKNLPKQIWEIAKDIVSFFWRGYRRLGSLIREGVESAWGFIKGLPRRYFELAKDILGFFWRGYRNIGKMLRKGIEDVWDWLKGLPKRLGDIAVDAAKAFGKAFKGLGQAIIDGIVGGAKGAGQLVLKIVGGIFNLINGAWNKFLGGREIGVGPVKFTIPKLDLHLAEGGPVPGSGDGDTVRALLTPGEHVLTKSEVQAAGGHDAIFALRRMLGGGGQGGPLGFAFGGALTDPRSNLSSVPSPSQFRDPVNAVDYKVVNKRAADARKEDAEDRKKSLATEREDYKRSGSERAKDNRIMWNDILTTTRRAANDVEEQIRDMRVNTAKTFGRMTRDLTGAWSAMWFSLMKVTNEGLTYIGHETNQALKALGEKHINFGLTPPKSPSSGNEGGATTSTDHTKGGRFAPGGWVGSQGQRGRDKGGYALGAGEAVLNWAHQPYVNAALSEKYGFGLGGLFDRVRGFHAGGPGQAGFAGGKPPEFGPIPGMPGEEANTRVIPLIVRLVKRYNATITDAFDRDHSAGHVSPGHNVYGTAIDAVPSAGNWGAIEAMGKWAVAKGMTVGYGAGVPGSQAWPGHGRGLHIHIELGNNPSAAGEVLNETMAKIGRPLVKGAKALASLSQAAIDKVLKVANAKLAETFAATAGGATDFEPGDVGPGAGPIFKFFRDNNFTDEQSAAWVGNFQQESGLDPSIVQPNGEGHGLAQWGGGRFAALMAFAKSHGKRWTDSGVQLAFVMHELHGSESTAFKHIKAAKTVEEATNAIGTYYERYGIQGDRSGPARNAFEKYAGQYAEGGIVPGGEGAPVPILAHAGEWVLNKGQQLRAAMLSGLTPSALKSMLGFYGGGGAFAGGGVATVLKSVGKGVKEPDDLFEGVDEALKEVRRVMKGVIKLKKLKNIADIIDLATKEGGLLDNLRSNIESQFAKANLDLRRKALTVRAGRVVRRDQTNVQVAEGALAQRRDERGDLTDERREIQQQLDAVEKRRSGVKRGGKAWKDLTAKQVALQGRLDEANERVMSNEEEILAAQETLAKARTDAMQAIVDKVKDKYDKLQTKADLGKRVAAALGVGMETVNNTIEANMNSNLAELRAALIDATAKGETDIASKLAEDIAELEVSIQEFAQQKLRDAADAIEKEGSNKRKVLDLFGRMADAMGVVGQGVAAAIPGVPGAVGTGLGAMTRGQVAKGRIEADTTERGKYVDLLGKAQAAGNVGLSTELIDKINELTVSIQENIMAERQANITANKDAFDSRTGMLDLETQLVQATDAATGQTSSTKLLELATQRKQMFETRGQEIEKELAEAREAGDAKTTAELERALLENKIAVQQNTAAVNELTGAGSTPATYSSTAWEWMRTAFLTGTGGIMPQYAQPTITNVGGVGLAGPSTNTNNGGNTYNTTVEVNEAGQPVDATHIGGVVTFAQATIP